MQIKNKMRNYNTQIAQIHDDQSKVKVVCIKYILSDFEYDF